jgi:hypothetical protein
MTAPLILKRASASRSSGQWNDEDYDVLADGKVVGRIYEDASAGTPPELRWLIANYGNGEDGRHQKRWASSGGHHDTTSRSLSIAVVQYDPTVSCLPICAAVMHITALGFSVMPKTKRCIIGDAASNDTASLDQKLFLVFVTPIDTLPSALWRLVTLFRLPKASVADFEIESLPSALWRLVTLLRSPKASVVDFEIESLPSALWRLVTLCRLPKPSVLVCVMLTEPPCAEAVSANVSEIAKAAARTARVFMTAYLSVVAFPSKA